jgi:hypothetical protein
LAGGSTSRHPTRMAPPSWPWQLQWPARTAEPAKPPSKRDIPVTTSTILTPCKSGDTSTRRGCGDEPVHDPVSIRGCFGRCVPMEIPTCQLKMSPSEGRTSDGGVTSPPLHLHHPLRRPLPRIQARREFPPPPPPRPCRHPGGALVSSPLPPCPQSFAVDMIGLSYRLILR